MILFILFLFFSFRLANKGQEGEGWKFYFKLFCFSEPESVPADSVEFAFMFEQVWFQFKIWPKKTNNRAINHLNMHTFIFIM